MPDKRALRPRCLTCRARTASRRLTAAVEGWLVPGCNPFGLYLYVEEVDELAARMGCRAEDKP